jgi:hypothetical protein
MLGWPTHFLEMVEVLVVILGPVPLALALVRRWGEGAHGVLENLLAVIVLATASQLGLGLGLGFVGWLDTMPLILGETLLLATGIVIGRRTGFARVIPSGPLTVVEASSLLIVLIAGGLGAADLVVKPTQNFDSLAYHLPVMARWVSSGSLELFRALGQIALYPSHYELLCTLLVLPTGQDLLVSLPNLLAWLQLALAIVLLARRLGASGEAGAVAAALVVATPSVLSRLDAVQPDIALAATFLTALGFGLRPSGPGRRLDVAVIALTFGILAGLKLSGPVYVLLLLPGLVLGAGLRWQPAARVLRRLNPASPGVGLRFALAIAAFAGAVGLAWYLRNWIALGNPFGDLQIALAGRTLFGGSITAEELRRGSLASLFVLSSGHDWSVLAGVLSEWLGLGIVALALAAVLAFVRRGGAERRAKILSAVLLVGCVVLYWRTPYSGDNGTHGWQVTPWIEVGLRYGFPALGLLGALGAAGLSRSVWLVRAALGLLVATTVKTMLDELIVNAVVLVVVVLAAWGLAIAAHRARLGTRPVAAGAVAFLLVVAVGLQFARTEREDRRRYHFGQIVEVLAAELDDRDVVAVVNSKKLHLAAGMDWRRRVEVPPLPTPGRGPAWLDELRRQGVTAILVGHQEPDEGDREVVGWTQSFLRSSDQLELILDYESQAKDLALFRLKPAQSNR